MDPMRRRFAVRAQAIGMLEPVQHRKQAPILLGSQFRLFRTGVKGIERDICSMTSIGLDVQRCFPVPKIISRMSILKRYNSTRKLAKYISSRSVSVSKDNIHRHSRHTIGVKAYKRPS